MTELLTRVDDLEVNEVPDGYVIYETERDRVHYLNKTAAIVFEFCDGKRDADDIVTRVKLLFDLGSSADAEIRGAIDALLKEGLILSCSK
jgi:coenzyme PQQ synthesis protein D (PqqD)